MANVDDTVTAEWTWGGHRFSAHGVVTKVSGKTTKVRLTEHAGEHFAPGVVVTVPTENVRKKEKTMAKTPLHGRQAPRPRMNAGRHIAPGYPAERFRIGQDVAMISNPGLLGHVVGFDPDGSVMVQWSGGRTVTGVDPRNLRVQGRGYAGRRASEAPKMSGAQQWQDRILRNADDYAAGRISWDVWSARQSEMWEKIRTKGRRLVSQVLNLQFETGYNYSPPYPGSGVSEARRSSSARPLPGRHHSRESSTPSKRDIDEMFDAYVETALWSSTAEDDTPLDLLDAEVAASALDKMSKDVESFARENAHLIESADVATHQYGRWGRAGHDFWLTRSGHGAGFWDGDWEPEATAERLTDAAHAYGETYLYVGDDGMIYSD